MQKPNKTNPSWGDALLDIAKKLRFFFFQNEFFRIVTLYSIRFFWGRRDEQKKIKGNYFVTLGHDGKIYISTTIDKYYILITHNNFHDVVNTSFYPIRYFFSLVLGG